MKEKTFRAKVRQYLPTIVKDAIQFFVTLLKILQQPDQYKLPENLSEAVSSAKPTEIQVWIWELFLGLTTLPRFAFLPGLRLHSVLQRECVTQGLSRAVSSGMWHLLKPAHKVLNPQRKIKRRHIDLISFCSAFNFHIMAHLIMASYCCLCNTCVRCIYCFFLPGEKKFLLNSFNIMKKRDVVKPFYFPLF